MTKSVFSSGGLILAIALTGCGDSRLKDLSLEIDRDSVATVMKTDAPHRSESYFTEGKHWEVLYYGKTDVMSSDSVAWRNLSPVILADGKVTGWGWKYWERQAESLRVSLPAED